MSIIKSITRMLLERRTASTVLGKQATAAKRAAGDIRRQLQGVGEGLTKADHATLTDAARILDAISEASASAKRQRKLEEAAELSRFDAALKAVEKAFSDVVDPAGVVVMLATGGSYRMHRPPEKVNKVDDAYDAREIMGRERRDALDYFAYRIARDSANDVATEAATTRAKFDQVRAGIEAKHSALIQALTNELNKAPT